MSKIKLCIMLLFCVLILCGCSHNDKQTKIQFASWGSKTEIEILKPILAEFEEKNPDINVEFLHIPQNYFQKIHLLFASNTSPDVIFINNLYLPLYANHLLELEKPYGYYPQAIEAMSYNQKLYAIPRDVSNLVIFYNKNLFDKKNISYPVASWTFEDFLNTAKKLTDTNTFGISFEEDPLFYLPYLMSNGGDFYEINKPESQNAIDFYANLRNKYHVAPLKSESASATMAQLFIQQRIGMYISGRWMVPKLREEADFDWDIIQFPNGKKGSIVPLDASGWAISKYSKNKTCAKKLIDFMSSKENSERFAQSGLIIPARIDSSQIILDDKKPKNAKIFLDIIKTSKPTPVKPDYKEVIDKLQKEYESKFNQL